MSGVLWYKKSNSGCSFILWLMLPFCNFLMFSTYILYLETYSHSNKGTLFSPDWFFLQTLPTVISKFFYLSLHLLMCGIHAISDRLVFLHLMYFYCHFPNLLRLTAHFALSRSLNSPLLYLFVLFQCFMKQSKNNYRSLFMHTFF